MERGTGVKDFSKQGNPRRYGLFEKGEIHTLCELCYTLLHVAHWIIKFIGMLILLSTDLEITINHWTLTDRDVVLSDRTFLPSDTTADGE